VSNRLLLVRRVGEGTTHGYVHVRDFAGTCREAFKYYEKHLGGTIGMLMTHGEVPGQSPLGPEWKDAVLHARLSVAGAELAGADIPGAQPMRSAYLSLNVDSDADAERIFAALADGGDVLMKLEETFFASRFGQVRDRFGINWMIVRQRS
jgi:PhnB protein